MRKTIVFGVFLLVAPAAFADEVVLKNGAVVVGEATRSGTKVVVELDIGTVAFDQDEVQEIRESSTALQELELRRAKLRADDVAGLRALAGWAETNGLEAQARALWRRVLELAPADARAHQKLGHKQHQGRWLDEDEYMLAQGYTRYFGEWLTAEELKARELAMNERREERARNYQQRRPEPEPLPVLPEIRDEAHHISDLEYYGWSPLHGGSIYWGTNPYYWPQTHSRRAVPKVRANLRPAHTRRPR
jgi:hypothetical protein